MNEYRMKDDGRILTLAEYCALHPRVSFAADFVPSDADEIAETDPPQTTVYQRLERDGAEQISGRWQMKWKLVAVSAEEAAAIDRQLVADARAAAKRRRDELIANLVVTVDGIAFNGDEVSQGRMLRKIFDMEQRGIAEAPWTLADNSREPVTIAQLRAALMAAEQQQSAIWDISDPD